MSTPVLAVLVPVHDQAAFLPRALDGLLRQDVHGWEAVVVDDGSPDADAVAAVVGDLGDRRIRLVRSVANRGLGAALTTGLEATSAPLVAYLPADDVWYAGHLSALLACLDDEAVVLARSGLTAPADGRHEQVG